MRAPRLRVDHLDAAGHTALRVVHDGVDDRVGADGEPAGLLRPRQRAAVAAEVATIRAAAHALVAVLAGGAALGVVDEARDLKMLVLKVQL